MANHGYLIDAANREVREVEFETGELQKLVGGWLTTAWTWDSGDVLFVDDEGLLKAQEHFFLFAPRRDGQPMAGNGMVVGPEVEDDGPHGYHNDPPAIALDELRGLVAFRDRAFFDAWAATHAGEPAVTVMMVGDGFEPKGKPEVLTTYGDIARDMPRPVIGYAIESEDLEKMRQIADVLHSGTDRERHLGHMLWLVVCAAEKNAIGG